MIWTKKHKPTNFDGIVGNGKKIKQLCDNGDIPHLLLYGNAGQGKSLTIETIVNTYNLNYIKINASEERGIDILRGKLKDFAMSATSNGKRKAIVFEEFDRLTPEAFDALKDFIEYYENTTIFLASCNKIWNVPDPIKSRFTDIEYGNYPMEEIFNHLKGIVNIEKVDIDDELLKVLIDYCKKDIRKCIITLELLSKLKRKIVIGDLKNDLEMVKNVHNLLKQRKFPDARQLILDSGIRGDDFLNDYHDYIIELSIKKGELNPDTTKKLIEKFFECISVLRFSANQDICIEWLLLKIMELL